MDNSAGPGHRRVVTSQLTVLGSCGAWPEPGRACSGFLLEHDGFRIVLDLGYGTLPRLLAELGSPAADGLDAVAITHRHSDHAIDLPGLFRARWFGNRGAPPLPLYCGADVLAQVVALEEDEDAVHRVFDWHPLPAAGYRVGPLLLESVALPHFVPNAGLRLTATGLTVAYTGDTGPSPALAELGREADLYVMEASDRDQQRGVPPATAQPKLHLDSHDAGAAAQAAGARRVLLMHFWPGNDREASRARAGEVFDGEVLLADEGLGVPLP